MFLDQDDRSPDELYHALVQQLAETFNRLETLLYSTAPLEAEDILGEIEHQVLPHAAWQLGQYHPHCAVIFRQAVIDAQQFRSRQQLEL